MSDFDPMDPWGEKSPWEVAGQNQSTTPQEPPVTDPNLPAATTTPALHPFKVGLTLKAAAGYDAEWITPTIYGSTADEVAQRTVELLHALKNHGVIELTAKAAAYARGQYQGSAGKPTQPAGTKPTFQNGKIQQRPQSANSPTVDGDSCPHGRTLRSGKSSRGEWTALFCDAPRGKQCDPLWKQADGTFA